MKQPDQFKCPVCASELKSTPGQVLDLKDGVTVYCANKECPAQEVAGHGSNEKDAFQVIQDKFVKRVT